MTNNSMIKLTGFLFIAVFFFYGYGNSIIDSILTQPNHLELLKASNAKYIIGILLMLLNTISILLIGLILFNNLKEKNKLLALGYLTGRILEGVLLTLGIIALLVVVPLSNNYGNLLNTTNEYSQLLILLLTKFNFYAYQIGMLFLGLGSLCFCYILFKYRLIPNFITFSAFAGYLLLISASLFELLFL